jgi:hypothetical protein
VLGLAIIACVACQQHSGSTTMSCQHDGDCPSSMICQTCTSFCVFAPNTACNTSAPCPCGFSCRAQSCTTNLGVATPACVYDRDCPVDEFCNRAKYQCQFPMQLSATVGGTCTTNAECGEGSVCTTANTPHLCVENLTHECFADDECPTGQRCNPDGQCEHHTC